MPGCDDACRGALATAICAALEMHLPHANMSQADETLAHAVSDGQGGTARMVSLTDSSPMLAARVGLFHAEFGCASGAPPLQSKVVANGKSGSSFLVGGGTNVSPDDSRSYSVILKQLDGPESTLLATFYTRLVARYIDRRGSLLAQLLGRARYMPATGKPFEAVMMDNIGRAPPGTASTRFANWSPFDMKGIRLYSHETRLRAQAEQRAVTKR